MAEYLIQDTTLSGIADEIRILNDTTSTMSTAVMKSNLMEFNSDMNASIAEQDNLIAQIISALDGKVTGSSVIVGATTLSASNPSITISNVTEKDNVVLMYMDSGGYQASAMADAGLGNVIVHGESHSYTIMYADGLYAYSDDGFINYDKTTGRIYISSNMRYNETFVAGKYIYVAW